MNKNEIMQLGMQAKLCSQSGGINDEYDFEEEIIAFANLVAAAEREACAKVCDAECNPTPYEGHITTYQSGGYIMAEYLSAAIRLRGQDEPTIDGWPLYSGLPQREWVGLTNEERLALFSDLECDLECLKPAQYARAIEAKLKEKNV